MSESRASTRESVRASTREPGINNIPLGEYTSAAKDKGWQKRSQRLWFTEDEDGNKYYILLYNYSSPDDIPEALAFVQMDEDDRAKHGEYDPTTASRRKRRQLKSKKRKSKRKSRRKSRRKSKRKSRRKSKKRISKRRSKKR